MLVMQPPIDGGTIVVTGASGGIGRELAVQLAGRAGLRGYWWHGPSSAWKGCGDELAARHQQLQVVVVSADLVAVTRLTAGLVPGMVARGRGGVLNVGSGAGLTVVPASVAYTASKHFEDGLSEALRADLAGTGVVVTQVCPGPVDSAFEQAAGSVGGWPAARPGSCASAPSSAPGKGGPGSTVGCHRCSRAGLTEC